MLLDSISKEEKLAPKGSINAWLGHAIDGSPLQAGQGGRAGPKTAA